MSAPRLRAPREDGGVVARPPLEEAGALLAVNVQRLRQVDPVFIGWPLSAMRSAARHGVIAQAREYHREADEPVPFSLPHAIVMAGHQPELFHPGVWVKNFALAGLARRLHVTAINLIVDNDTLKSTELRLPVLTTGGEPWPHVESLRFDRRQGEVPWEEAVVQSEALFASLAERAVPLTADWGFSPLLPQLWADVLRQAERTPLVGERFVRARRALERQWGCHNLEVPVSRLCRIEPFVWFACFLLQELPRFHRLYNEVVHDYRRRHGIRSHSHPVPDLAAQDGWLEAPFWAWRLGDRRRGRLMVRRTESVLQLRVGAERWPDLPAEGVALPRAWQQLERQGLKVRSRALTNTLFARLLLCDLFLHGIGGGLYDELTDQLLQRFFGVEPPGYMVLSATRLLPLPTFAITVEDERRLARLHRDLHWNPQRHLAHVSEEWLNARAALLAAQPQTRLEGRQRYRDLRRQLDHLRPALADVKASVEQQWQLCRRQVQANAVLTRRDYSFCWHPESLLRPFCTQFL